MFHPNDHGYAVWAEAFRPTVTERAAELSAAESATLGADAATVGGRR
jgi:hypothetical protein